MTIGDVFGNNSFITKLIEKSKIDVQIVKGPAFRDSSIDIATMLHTKNEVLEIVYQAYLKGYTIEDIMFILLINLDISMSFNKINEIIDYLNYLNV